MTGETNEGYGWGWWWPNPTTKVWHRTLQPQEVFAREQWDYARNYQGHVRLACTLRWVPESEAMDYRCSPGEFGGRVCGHPACSAEFPP